MKTSLQSLRRITLLIILTSGFSTMAMATTFTATASGAWSSSLTWSGGTAPSYTNTADEVIISSGVTVTMDNDVTMNGATATMEVEGTLSSTEAFTFTDATGTVSGSGTIAVNSVVLESGAVLLFSGTITTNYFSSSVLALDALAKITVNKGLTLSAGLLTFDTNSLLSLGSNTTLTMAGGSMINTSGTLDFSSHYSVVYTTAYSYTGAELTGSGLQSVTINPGSGNSVMLSNNVTVAGTLALTSGTFVLNGNNLTIVGDIAANGNGMISSNSSSNIIINTATTTSGTLWFANNSNTVNNFTVNIADGGWANLGSDMTVNGTLVLTKGTLYVSNGTLQIAASGSISGASSSNYVVTNSGGYLSMFVTASATTAMYYPVGTPSQYFPANIWLNSGANSGSVRVNASSNVYGHGTTGSVVSQTQSMVNATWNIRSDDSTNTNLKMQLMWNTSAEVNAFDRTHAYISHFTNGSWDVSTTAAASLQSNGMYALTRDNVQSLSPFAVFDDNTNAGIENNAAANIGFSLYPNPASSLLYITNNINPDQQIYADLVNMDGKNMGTYQLSGNTSQINVASLPSGLYFIRLYDNNTSATAKFVKY